MTFNDGEDYPTVIKDAVIKIYNGETLVETLVSDIYGEAETRLANAGTYRVTIEHPHREIMDVEIVASESNHLFFQLANEPRRQARTTAIENMVLTAKGYLKIPDGNETLTLTPTVNHETLVGETMSLDEPEVTIAASSWLLMVKKVLTDEDYTQGTIDPDEGNNQVVTHNRSCTARTKQYCLYNYMYADGILEQNNQSTTMELLNKAHVFDFKDVPFGTIHLLIVFYRAAWEITASGTTEDGTNEVLDGQSHTFTNNLGTAPECYRVFNPNPPYQLLSIHYATYQWMLNSQNVGYGAGAYNVPAKTKGTSHTISCAWTCVGV